MDAEPISADGPRAARPLERPYVRWELIRELAAGLKTGPQLAEEYGVTLGSIQNFKARWLSDIERQRADFENEFATLWIAKKGARLAVLQDDIEETADSYEPDMMKVRHAALHQAAKELGQVPSAAGVHIQTQTATFSINGVDLDQLR